MFDPREECLAHISQGKWQYLRDNYNQGGDQLITSLSGNLAAAGKLLLAGFIASATALLIFTGVITEAIAPPGFPAKLPPWMAMRVLGLSVLGCGVGYYISLSRALASCRRLEFHLGRSREEVEDHLRGSNWLVTTTLVRHMMEVWIAFVVFVPFAISGGLLLGIVSSLPYFAANFNFSFEYLSPNLSWGRRFVSRGLARELRAYGLATMRAQQASSWDQAEFEKFATDWVDRVLRENGFVRGSLQMGSLHNASVGMYSDWSMNRKSRDEEA